MDDEDDYSRQSRISVSHTIQIPQCFDTTFFYSLLPVLPLDIACPTYPLSALHLAMQSNFSFN
jgi:hypothetical protein